MLGCGVYLLSEHTISRIDIMASHHISELAKAKWVSNLVATDDVIRGALLNANPEKVDAVFRSSEIKELLSQLLELSFANTSSETKKKKQKKKKKKLVLSRRLKKKDSNGSGLSSSSSRSPSVIATSTNKKTKNKVLRKKKKSKKTVPSSTTTTTNNNKDNENKHYYYYGYDNSRDSPTVGSPRLSTHSLNSNGLPSLSSDDDALVNGHLDLESTVYWGELNHPNFGGNGRTYSGFSDSGAGNSSNSRTSSNETSISANSGSIGAISDQEGILLSQDNESPRGRRVSFAEDVWVQEIPKVDQSLIKDLFYSEADIDDMYQEAEDEVLNATVPLTASGGTRLGGLDTERGTGFNSTI